MDQAFESVTRHIRVRVRPVYLEQDSEPADHQYIWAYAVRLANEGEETVQLLTRHWIITDGAGRVQEVRGEGVVGEQPVLAPGETYEYTSGVPLSTPGGFMGGTYTFRSKAGDTFEVEIPTFSLDSGYGDTSVN